jgi:hypothetical protein
MVEVVQKIFQIAGSLVQFDFVFGTYLADLNEYIHSISQELFSLPALFQFNLHSTVKRRGRILSGVAGPRICLEIVHAAEFAAPSFNSSLRALD